MTMKRREEQLESFKQDPKIPVFLLNKICGAVGINLTCATHVLILEASWNPVWESQAIGRAHRLGQTGPITVTRYVLEGKPPLIHMPEYSDAVSLSLSRVF
jgi:SNF2 family DNA or RNA helicase